MVEDPAVTQQPTAEVWITRQNAPVLQELKENLEQEEFVAMYLTRDQVEWPVVTEKEVMEVVEHVCHLEHLELQDLKKLSVINFPTVPLTDNVKEFLGDALILVRTM